MYAQVVSSLVPGLSSGLLASGLPGSIAGSARRSLASVFAVPSLAHLGALDIFVIVVYFAMVIWIGYYLKNKASTSEEFFMAGRDMTAWIAGLSFVSANLGSLELMGYV